VVSVTVPHGRFLGFLDYGIKVSAGIPLFTEPG
jgi:hypothetical protein